MRIVMPKFATLTFMDKQGKLMEMLIGYAAAHQHPFNVAVHLVGIPTIMLGVLIPLTWASVDIDGFALTFAQIAVVGFFLFYMSLDVLFAVVFLVLGLALSALAGYLGSFGTITSGILAACLFLGGYLAQFIGHYVERSVPVILKHPVQANLAAPFFTVVEIFGLLGLRKQLFDAVRLQIEERRHSEAGAS